MIRVFKVRVDDALLNADGSLAFGMPASAVRFVPIEGSDEYVLEITSVGRPKAPPGDKP